jgi:hypothetical protein
MDDQGASDRESDAKASNDQRLTLCAVVTTLSAGLRESCRRHPSAPRNAKLLAFEAGCEDY